MTVITINTQDDPRWLDLLTRYDSDAFHAPRWARVLNDTYGLTIQANLLLDDAGTPVAGVTFCKIEDMKGPRIVMLPFSDYCDPLVETEAQWRTLVADLFEEGCSITLRCLHNDVPLADDRFNRYYRARWHGLDLTPDSDTLWGNLHSSARRAVRKAEKSGVTIRLAAGPEDVREFFNLHLGIRKYRYQLVAQPYRFFQYIWDHFCADDNGFIMLAEQDGSVIGSIYFLIWGDTLYYKFNASSLEERGVRPNDMMVWEGIKQGQARGLKKMDFGLSDWDQEGLIRYKRKFASEEKAISFLRYNPLAQPTPVQRELGALFPQLTDLFTDPSVPDAITEKAGDLLYRYFV